MSFLLLFHSLLILGIYFMKILKSLALDSLSWKNHLIHEKNENIQRDTKLYLVT